MNVTQERDLRMVVREKIVSQEHCGLPEVKEKHVVAQLNITEYMLTERWAPNDIRPYELPVGVKEDDVISVMTNVNHIKAYIRHDLLVCRNMDERDYEGSVVVKVVWI